MAPLNEKNYRLIIDFANVDLAKQIHYAEWNN